MDIKEFIFNTYKDLPLTAKKFKKEIIEKYHIKHEDAREVYVRINNYQVKKYGKSLNIYEEILIYSKEETRRINANAWQRNRKRREYNEHKKSYIRASNNKKEI